MRTFGCNENFFLFFLFFGGVGVGAGRFMHRWLHSRDYKIDRVMINNLLARIAIVAIFCSTVVVNSSKAPKFAANPIHAIDIAFVRILLRNISCVVSCWKVRNATNLRTNCESTSLTAEIHSSHDHEIRHQRYVQRPEKTGHFRRRLGSTTT